MSDTEKFEAPDDFANQVRALKKGESVGRVRRREFNQTTFSDMKKELDRIGNIASVARVRQATGRTFIIETGYHVTTKGAIIFVATVTRTE